MKRMMIYSMALLFLFFIGGCTVSGIGGTETGTSTGGLSDLGTKVEAVAASLIPIATGEGLDTTALSAPYAITYGASEDWQDYLDNIYIVTDVFGSADEDPAPVTRIRVLLDNFKSTLEELVSLDSDFDCAETEALDTSDTIEIAFYGEIANGSADNRSFSCVSVQENENGDYTTIYGQDNEGIVHVVSMSNTLHNVEEEYQAERGTVANILSVIHVVYKDEESSEGVVVASLDLQYAQASLYTGPDEEHGTADDMTFKSRTRITGNAELDGLNSATAGTGDFIVTKFDSSPDENDTPSIITTQYAGRGSYDEGAYSLFKVQTDISSLPSDLHYFCLQHGGSMPESAETAQCAAYENTPTWSESFPLEPTPAIEENFEDVVFFAGDDTDLIANDMSNFAIPVYPTLQGGAQGETTDEGEASSGGESAE